MSTATVTPPPVVWAQRNDVLFVTINAETKDPEIKFTEQSLYFKATGLPENKQHEVTINFLKKINPDKVQSKNCGRCYEFIIFKGEGAMEFWNSLTSDKKKPHWLKVDFNKWKDEDEVDTDEEAGMGGGMGGMGDGGMGNMMGGGMPGMGGMGGPGGMSNFNDLMAQMGGMRGGDGKPSFDDIDGEEDSDDEPLPDLEGAQEKK